MQKRTILENDDVVLWLHVDTGIIHHEVKRAIMGESLRMVLELGYQELRKAQINKWLSDDRRLGPFSREDQKWCENVWFPKTRDAGWQFWAIVLPETVLGQMSLQYFESKYSEQGISTNFFDNPDTALTWLVAQPGRFPILSAEPGSAFSPETSSR